MPNHSPFPPKARFRLACVITPHGFGHAARAAAIMAALARLLDVHFEIITEVPEWFFRESINNPFTYHHLATDVGLAQNSSLETDNQATLTRLAELYPLRQETIDRVASLVKGCDLVLADIAPLGLAAAQKAGLPSVVVENFTWDWIYREYARLWPALAPYGDYLETIYQLATYRIQSQPLCRPGKCNLLTAPISREIKTQRSLIRSQLQVEDGRKVFLITMGGIGGDNFALEPLKKQTDLIFILPGLATRFSQEGNLRLLPKNSGFFHPDLVNAADVVIGKTGYSTLAEVYQAGNAWGFLSRTDFPEAGPLAEFINKQMQGVELSTDDFLSGRWVEHIPHLLQLPRNFSPRENGAVQAARYLAALLIG